MKKILSIFLTACICITMVGCNKGTENENGDDISLSPSDSSVKYKPSKEIIEADFSSGLVQIGNDIFKNGGFMTVKELCEQLKGKYTYEEQFYDRDYSVKNRPVLYLTNEKDEELVVRVEYAAPLSGVEQTVPNCIVMNILPDNEYSSTYTWLPNGVEACSTEDRKDEIIELYKSKGYVDVTSEDFAEDFINKTFAQNIGSYVVDCKGYYTVASIQIDGENLYGSSPITTIWLARFPNIDTDNFFYGNHIGYQVGNPTLIWKSPLR